MMKPSPPDSDTRQPRNRSRSAVKAGFSSLGVASVFFSSWLIYARLYGIGVYLRSTKSA